VSGASEDGKATNGAGAGQDQKRKKKYKVVLHTSPFLRCIQTSTGIAAGLAQFQPPGESGSAESPTATKLSIPRPALDRNGSLGSSVLAKSPRSRSLAVQPVHAIDRAGSNAQSSSRTHARPDKTLLRIDAFLGEWLSPDYFEDITPPPNSTMMVAGAKADLLRRGEYVEILPPAPQSRGNFPGGWKSNAASIVASRKKNDEAPFPTLGSLAQALPHRERSCSGSGPLMRVRSREHAAPSLTTAHKVPSHIYDPPMPSYAVSPASPIPRGYVSHARDACVNVDWQWDSMREPQGWGDGGEYGDEWSTMHKRFRRGLAGMMQWYKENGSSPPKTRFLRLTSERPKATLTHAATDPGVKAGQEEDDDDEELVLVLVTHGAGCNALLGAISNQPILIDVGLAALSMAVRRQEPRRPSVPVLQRRPSVVDPGMSDTYEMKYLASLDHLRPGVDPAKPPQQQSPATVASPSVESRRRFGHGSNGTNSPVSAIDSPFAFGESARSGWNSSLGSMRRSSTSGTGSGSRILSSSGTSSSMASSGLWSVSKAPSYDSSSDGRQSPGAEMARSFANQAPKSTSNPAIADDTDTATRIPNLNGTSSMGLGINGHEDKEKDDDVAPLRKAKQVSRSTSVNGGAGGLWAPKTQSAVHGLWGPPRLDDVYEHPYDTPKRRWTVSENE
jgi:hypothetical protein